MRKFILTSSFLVLGMASAYAADTTADIKATADNLGTKIENSMDRTAAKVEAKYNEMKVSVMDSSKSRETKFIEQSLNTEATAKKMLGKTIVDTKGEKIGTLEDIIVDANGKATWAVVADGDFVGIGKKAAFQYGNVITQKKDGDIVASISENNIKAAKEFSYDAKDAADGKTTIPSGSYSVKELLDADIETSAKNLDLDLENIAFKDGQAQYFVFEADNDKSDKDGYAAVAFKDVKIVPKNDKNEVDLQLTAAQEQSLLSHISTASQ